MEALVEQYLAQLVPGFLFCFYFIGYQNNLSLFIFQILFYGIVISVSIRSAYICAELLTLQTIKLVITHSRKRIGVVQTRYEKDTRAQAKSLLDTAARVVDKCDRVSRTCSGRVKKIYEGFKEPKGLFKPQTDNYFIIVAFVLVVGIDKFVRRGEKNIKALFYEIAIMVLLWALLKGFKIIIIISQLFWEGRNLKANS